MLKKQLSPSASELDTNIWLTHRTPVLPKNGMMIPGRLLTDIDPKGLSARELHQKTLSYVPNTRMTLHWFPQDLVAAHNQYSNQTSFFISEYIILEKVANLKNQLFGGYAEDFWLVGPYQLSKDAIILVPKEKVELAKKELDGFQGKIMFYSCSPLDVKVNKMVKKMISEKSNLVIDVPPDQTKKVKADPRQIIMLLEQDPTNGLLLSFKDAALRAISNGQPSIIVDDNCPPEELQIIVNGKNQFAKDFFSSWEKQGLFSSGHENSIFGKFEEVLKKTIHPLCAVYYFYIKSDRNMNISEQQLKEIILQGATPEVINTVKNLVNDIKTTLTQRKYPAKVLDYFHDEWEINLSIWLDLLEDLYSIAESGKIDLKEIKEKIKSVAEKVGAVNSEKSSVLEKHSTVNYLQENCVNLTFWATLRNNQAVGYVDVHSKSSNKMEHEQILTLHKALNRKGVPHEYIKDSATPFNSSLVIFKTNTKQVRTELQTIVQNGEHLNKTV